MSDNLMEKVSAFGERLKIGGAEVGRKMTAGMSSMSFKMKELFQGPNQTDKIVDDATSENLDEPDWAMNLDICDMINTERINSIELIRGIKRRIMLKSPRIQYLALVLLETCVKNCEKAFSEVAAERVLDEMVKLIEDPQTVVNNRNKALMLIESWGESTNELRYLPVYEETYKDDLTTTLVQQCRQAQFTVQRIIETAGDNEALLFEALNVNDEIQKVLSKFEELKKPSVPPEPEPAMIPVAVEPDESPRHAKEDALIRKPAGSRVEFGYSIIPVDDLTTTLVQQCRQAQFTVQRIIETAGDNEALLFEALNVNDEIQKVLSKFEELKKPSVPPEPEPAMIPVAVEPDESPRHAKEDALIRKPAGSRGGGPGGSTDEMMDDLDEMIFGKKGGGTSESGHDSKKQPPKGDLISL
nr:target of myb protein 1 [Quercus suber]